jgi:hypothetical protein
LEEVDDLDAVYLLLLLHVELEHDEEGTQRSDEPAGKDCKYVLYEIQRTSVLSKSTRNFCAGVPMEIVPAHSSSSSSSVRASFWRFSTVGTVRASLIEAPYASRQNSG